MGDTATPRADLNIRKATAGRALLENPGMPIKQALLSAGYSMSTATKPLEKVGGVRGCIAEAVKADPSIDPANLLSKARKAFVGSLDGVLAGPLGAKTLPMVTRALAVAESAYGAAADPDSEASADSFARRLAWLRRVNRQLVAGESTLDHPTDSEKG